MQTAIIVAVLAGYLLGNLNGAVTVSSLMEDQDVRKKGSGNAGITNFFRNYGGKNMGFVALIDLGKTVVACLVGRLLLEPYGFALEGIMLGGLAATLGHDFPAVLGFRGGKGILCGAGIALVLDLRVFVLIISVFAVLFLLTKYVSLGSLLAALTFAVSIALLYWDRPWVVAAGTAVWLLATFMHRGNISRLIHHTETKTYLNQNKRS